MDQQKHTSEIKLECLENGIIYDLLEIHGEDRHYIGEVGRKEKAQRIVQCVNALAGIEDVGVFMEAVKQEIVWAIERTENPFTSERINAVLALFPKEKS